jgi:hypothetical protein
MEAESATILRNSAAKPWLVLLPQNLRILKKLGGLKKRNQANIEEPRDLDLTVTPRGN